MGAACPACGEGRRGTRGGSRAPMPAKAHHEPIARLLGATDMFKGLRADELAACAASFQECRFAKGQLIFARGDAGAHLYLVAEGRVRLAIGTSEGRELSFQIARTGDLIGEITSGRARAWAVPPLAIEPPGVRSMLAASVPST